MTRLMDLLTTSGTRILADTRFHVAEHGQRDGEWIHIDSDVARITLTDHHGEQWLLVGPLWDRSIGHQTGAYGLMIYEAGSVVDPPAGHEGALGAIGERVDLIQEICANEAAWGEFRAKLAEIHRADGRSSAELAARFGGNSESPPPYAS